MKRRQQTADYVTAAPDRAYKSALGWMRPGVVYPARVVGVWMGRNGATVYYRVEGGKFIAESNMAKYRRVSRMLRDAFNEREPTTERWYDTNWAIGAQLVRDDAGRICRMNAGFAVEIVISSGPFSPYEENQNKGKYP